MERVEQVKSHLLKNPGATSREIAKIIKISRSTVSAILRKIHIKTEKDGNEIRYFLAE